MKIGDTVKRVIGSFNGMQCGDTDRVTAVFPEEVNLANYPGFHGTGNLEVVRDTTRQETMKVEETFKPGAIGTAYKVTTTTAPPASESALAVQVDGSHYKSLAIQPIEYIHSNGIQFAEGCVIKYVSRWRTKGGIKDLEKAKHFIELLIELENKKNE
jgi:hypothetical protein